MACLMKLLLPDPVTPITAMAVISSTSDSLIRLTDLRRTECSAIVKTLQIDELL